MDSVQLSGSNAAQARSVRFVLARRSFLISITLVCSSNLLTTAGSAWADNASSLSDAVGVLEKERSAAEQYAVILATVGRKNVDAYVRGIQLYADAKSDFDGLTSQLRFDLIEGHDPTKSPKFASALEAAAKSRIAFTNFVSDEVVGKIEGAKPGLIDVVKVVPELVTAVTDAGLKIWDAYRNAGKERRDAILGEIDRLRWKSFADLAPKEN
jgi:hypothetical protein